MKNYHVTRTKESNSLLTFKMRNYEIIPKFIRCLARVDNNENLQFSIFLEISLHALLNRNIYLSKRNGKHCVL